eukprot:TRINITY_DN80304_c0_g1_i1.p1 TRINITY_DN80304_c0_g1~~TRINITY_DN80304_c0_g1_i1.p1  ORF type:complete len:378 (+),score=69.31 TRINITY_DN80304_c0_g1_i1:214-1347(+)
MTSMFDEGVCQITYKSVNRVRPMDLFAHLGEDRIIHFKPLPENCDMYGIPSDELPPPVKLKDVIKLEPRSHVDRSGRSTVYVILMHQSRGAELVSFVFSGRASRDLWLTELTKAVQAKDHDKGQGDEDDEGGSRAPAADRDAAAEDDTEVVAVPDDAPADGMGVQETTGLLSAVGGIVSSVAEAATSAADLVSSAVVQAPERHFYDEIRSIGAVNGAPGAVAAIEVEIQDPCSPKKVLETLEITKNEAADVKSAVTKFATELNVLPGQIPSLYKYVQAVVTRAQLVNNVEKIQDEIAELSFDKVMESDSQGSSKDTLLKHEQEASQALKKLIGEIPARVGRHGCGSSALVQILTRSCEKQIAVNRVSMKLSEQDAAG